MKNVKYTRDSKFIVVYVCAENYQNRDRFDKDIAKIKQGSFFASHGINAFKQPHSNDSDSLPVYQSRPQSVLIPRFRSHDSLLLPPKTATNNHI